MKEEKASARSSSYGRPWFPIRTGSIVADMATFRVAVSTVVFAMALLAIPTAMALFKQWGWW